MTLPSLLALANSYSQQPRTVYGVDPNVRTPNVKYWNAGIESRVKGFRFDVRYLGNRLEEGPRSVDRNQVMLPANFLATFRQVQANLAGGNPTSGFPPLPGNGLCANFSTQNCQPDLYARSLILAGAAGELARWYEGQGYNRSGAYNFLGKSARAARHRCVVSPGRLAIRRLAVDRCPSAREWLEPERQLCFLEGS